MHKNFITIKSIQLEKWDKTYRISAEVNGELLWFESQDTSLSPSPEAFANALLIPGMIQGFNLVFTDPLCTEWLESANKLMTLYNEWHGWQIISITSPKTTPRVISRGNKRALCFSGGVDSFHSLFTYPKEISYLVMVHGYDIALSDTKGADIVFNHIQDVANEVGLSAIKITTNYRQHAFAGRKYGWSYEGALAAIGNLITDTNELIISSSLSREETSAVNNLVFNSSTTAALRSLKGTTFTHYGDAFSRDEKLKMIATQPLLWRHLHVCQENLKSDFHLSGTTLNCGKCEKCIRTILSLMKEGIIDRVTVFQSTDNISNKIDAINSVEFIACPMYEPFLTSNLDEDIIHSIKALMTRSQFIGKHNWLSRRGIKIVAGYFKKRHWIETKYKNLFQDKAK